MTFRRRVRLDPRQVRDLRGRRPGAGGALMLGGGGTVGVIVLIVFVLLGGDVGSLVGPGGGGFDQGGPLGFDEGAIDDCETGADANERRDCRIVGFVNSVQTMWEDELPGYERAPTVLFTGSVRSRCGLATSATGPFYCPLDRSIYLDLGFFDAMRQRLGARGGPLAEGYVVAHEYGHHVQNLAGILDASGRDTGAGGGSVTVELQADCLAGLWVGRAASTGFLVPPTREDIAAGLDAAASVGDDRIQQRSGQEVDPHRWTHGSSEQRMAAFLAGLEADDAAAC